VRACLASWPESGAVVVLVCLGGPVDSHVWLDPPSG